MTNADIMRTLGGYRAVADFLGENPKVVHKWSTRGIPARFWPAVVRMADDHGIKEISLETLERPMWQRQRIAA